MTKGGIQMAPWTFIGLILATAALPGLVACGSSEGTSTSHAAVTTSDARAEGDGGLCAQWPKSADTFDPSTMSGCVPAANPVQRRQQV